MMYRLGITCVHMQKATLTNDKTNGGSYQTKADKKNTKKPPYETTLFRSSKSPYKYTTPLTPSTFKT